MSILKNIFGRKKNPSKEEIQSYLEGSLDQTKSRAFEEALSDNPLLGDAIEGFEAFGAKEIEGTPSLEAFYSQKTAHTRIRNARFYINRIAASLLGVMIVSALYMYWGETSSERIYANNFEEFYDPSIYALRGGDDPSARKEVHPTKKKAIDNFLEGKYSESIIYWEQYLEINQNDIQANMYLGYVYLEAGNPEKAIEYLTFIAGEEDSEYKDETKWYLALAQIKMKDKEAARETLKDIIENSHEFYGKKARVILRKL